MPRPVKKTESSKAEPKAARAPKKRTVKKTARKSRSKKAAASASSKAKSAVAASVPEERRISSGSRQASPESISHGHSVHTHVDIPLPVRMKKRLDARSQRLITWLGIGIIMTVIMIGWIINLSHMVGPDVKASSEEATDQVDFATLKRELSETMDEVQGNLRELREITETPVTDTAAPAPDAESAFEKFKETVEQQAVQSGTVSETALPNTLPE